MRLGSGENRSRGQYPNATGSPSRDLRLECIQNRQVRDLVGADRNLELGRKDHLGYEISEIWGKKMKSP